MNYQKNKVQTQPTQKKKEKKITKKEKKGAKDNNLISTTERIDKLFEAHRFHELPSN